MFTTLFLLIVFLFLYIESDKDVFDYQSYYDGLGPGYLVRALFYFWKFPLIVSVECFQLMESQNLVVVSVGYFQSEYFPAQKCSSFKFRFLL